MKSWDRRLEAAERFDGARTSQVARPPALELPDGLHPDDADAARQLFRHAVSASRNFSATIVGRITGADGRVVRRVELTIMGNGRVVEVLVADRVPEVTSDRLTGLPDRDHLISTIDSALAEVNEQGGDTAVFHIDIDRFKTVNDRYGYGYGDEMIVMVASSLAAVLRPEDTLARTGGDGFTIVCTGVLGPADAASLAESYRSIGNGLPAENPLSEITLSVGYTIGNEKSDGATLILESETALCRAKSLGRDRCEMFDEDLRGRVERRINVDHRLRGALDGDSIEVHYQPIIELVTKRVIGAEALLRVSGDDGRHLNPRELVSAAEDSGLIRRIEERVMRRALETLADLPDTSEDPLFMSINISDQRLSDSHFPLSLARALHDAGGSADQIHLEIHPAALSNSGAGVRLITQLRALGVTVVIDELSHTMEGDFVNSRSVDCVKLDQRVTQAIHGERGRVRAKLLIDAIRERGVDVCAVGVETAADMEAVTQLGCRFGQGYWFSPPVGEAKFRELVVDGLPIGA